MALRKCLEGWCDGSFMGSLVLILFTAASVWTAQQAP